uniref:Uncharacterized protein n=1 Tax=Rhodosorus marinus TaxID=101924 RepID=A0A7S2ZYY6_9RHOD|mmetsp:Transcript_38276/g.151432  ORF Transcript_38276/g.151432 Transcript_38276/m.151432 type:complete len:165 (+) Transcript_38276:955-1449(+)|eukprot:CAMPEP_0113966440 /NCGR_PEP_ID=MMETSP0011_2-20120614/8330_1 /TAXON_ID=101924 /ORGANISM="Rhodosorus marinus" /LENGTH=164 /DNA_ID=CAMNT_0000979121 /DNA_START=378 /DNA_END=872 /DNA_ORIENTATION=+ /assembly_acc=CAM_ASM_000156
MAVPLKKKGQERERILVVALAFVLLSTVVKYKLNSSRERFIVKDMQLLKMESVGHEESIVKLRAQWWTAHKELEKLQKEEKSARSGKSRFLLDQSKQKNQEAQAQARAARDDASQPQRAAENRAKSLVYENDKQYQEPAQAQAEAEADAAAQPEGAADKPAEVV